MHGYTLNEKVNIAQNYILSKVQKDNGIPHNSLLIPDRIMQKIVSEYTAEAGVRNLEKRLASLCRHIAVDYIDLKQRSAENSEKGDESKESAQQLSKSEVKVSSIETLIE